MVVPLQYYNAVFICRIAADGDIYTSILEINIHRMLKAEVITVLKSNIISILE